MKNESRTSTGATNSAICALEPIAMLTDRSILSFIAKKTATQCSAALPTIATTMMPTKNGDRPIDSEASVIEPTRISDITPTATPAIAEHGHGPAHRPRLAAARPRRCSGLKRSRWVLSEKNSPAT